MLAPWHRCFYAILTFAVTMSPLSAQDKATKHKLKELASLPTGLTIVHAPDTVFAMRGGPSGMPFTWVYQTTLSAAGDNRLAIVEYGDFVMWDGVWHLNTTDFKTFSPDRFGTRFGCPHGHVVPGSPCVDSLNWNGEPTLRAARVRWYFIGETLEGKRFKGEGEVEQLAQLSPEDPTQIAASEGRAVRIALDAVRLPSPLDKRQGPERFIDSVLAARLADDGYTVAPPDSVNEMRRQAADSLGGLYDPNTGEVDSDKATQASHLFHALVNQRLGADYILHAAVVVQSVPFRGSQAKWDGTTEQTGSPGMFFGGREGRLSALSLRVALEAPGEIPVYWNRGGIELLATLNGGNIVPVPTASLLTDQARLVAAVERALEGLPDRIPAHPAELRNVSSQPSPSSPSAP